MKRKGTAEGRGGSRKRGGPVKFRRIIANWQLYVFLLPALIYFIVFCYGPMYGVQIAFKNFSPSKGIAGSPWAGLEHFKRFFNAYYFWDLIRNTLTISIYSLAVNFILPVLLALLLNEMKKGKLKSAVQTATYAPYFISVVVFCGMITTFLSPASGIINKIIEAAGGTAVNFLTTPKLFPSVYVWANAWQATGWGSIIYLATLSGVDEQLHEAAMIDGANRLQRILHINIPHLLPTMITLLIMNAGSLLSVGYEKLLLLQNPLNTETSEVISTYVYQAGLVNAQYSFATAVGLFNSVINLIILILVNTLSRRISDTSLW